jgi:hypothetical protein
VSDSENSIIIRFFCNSNNESILFLLYFVTPSNLLVGNVVWDLDFEEPEEGGSETLQPPSMMSEVCGSRC